MSSSETCSSSYKNKLNQYKMELPEDNFTLDGATEQIIIHIIAIKDIVVGCEFQNWIYNSHNGIYRSILLWKYC